MKNLGQQQTKLLGSLLLLFLAHICLLHQPELLDPTEARYATISQRMVQSGNWMVPEIDRGDGFEPFWGKPPLHFWLTAASFRLLGFSELAARLPSMLAALGIAILMHIFCCRFFSRDRALLSLAIFGSAPPFMALSGACIIDLTLSFAIAGTLVSFAMFVADLESKPSKKWGLICAVFMAIGFMTKGPIACAVPALSIALWCGFGHEWSALKKLPWLSAGMIFIAICAPWFFLAEQKTPGLSYYFFIQENFGRFISDQYGDKYGSAHPIFRGAIWVFALATMLPWSIFPFFAGRGFYSKNRVREFIYSKKLRWEFYCLCWGLAPLLFFTLARSVIITYTLPAIPALAVVLAILILSPSLQTSLLVKNAIFVTSLIMLILAFGSALLGSIHSHNPISANTVVAAALIALGLKYVLKMRTAQGQFQQAYLLGILCSAAFLIAVNSLSSKINQSLSSKTLIDVASSLNPNSTLAFVEKLPYSAQFYARTRTPDAKLTLLVGGPKSLQIEQLLVLSNRQAQQLAPELSDLKQIGSAGKWNIFKRP